MKKLLLFTGTLTSVIAPTVSVVACDSSKPATPPTPTTVPMTKLDPAADPTYHCLNTPAPTDTSTSSGQLGTPMMPVSHTIKDVVNAANGTYYAWQYRSLWKNIEWADASDHAKGVALTPQGTEEKLQKIIEDSSCLLEDFYTKGSISWTTVKNAYVKAHQKDPAIQTDSTIENLKTKLMANLDAITTAVNGGIAQVKGAALMALAQQISELLSKYPPLITLSWGGDSGNVKNFAIPALIDQKPNNITVSDENSLMDYYKVALDVLLAN